MRPLPPIAAGACAAFALALPAAAQTPLHSSTGSAAGDLYGAALDDAGDVDGDGTTDLIVGAPEGNYVRILSGDSGQQIHRILRPFGADRFGASVIGLGDVDGDDHSDVVIGAPGSAPGDSTLQIYSGLQGTLLLSLTVLAGVDPWPAGGTAMAAVGDLDADGTTEFLVGIPDLGGLGPGSVLVLRFDLASFVYGSLDGVAPGDQFGFDVAAAGDVDGDGVTDLIVGTGAGGYARVHSGATLGLLHHFTGPGDGYGRVVSGAGDIDGDGRDDVAIGSPGLDFVDVMSGATGVLLRRFDAVSGAFGSAIAPLGDLDGDGTPDLAIGAPADTSLGTGGAGTAVIVSGSTGLQLFKYVGKVPGAALGGALAALADPTGDGKADLAIGAVGDGSAVVPGGGLAGVHSGGLAGSLLPYGFGCPDSFLITPVLELVGDPVAGGALTLSITRGYPGSLAVVLLGAGQGMLPLANGCILWVDPLLPPVLSLPLGGVFPGSGSALVAGHLPGGLPAGTVVTLQAFEAVLDTPGEIASSGAVQLTLQ